MSVKAIIGAQWGDEGKGKIVDFLSQKVDFIVRFNGGPNAGHTVLNKYGKFKLHLIPSGIFNKKAISIIGNGVVINPEVLVKEMKELKKAGVFCENLKISDKAHLILPWHLEIDAIEEKEREKKGKSIGTTLRGIGPAFSDKVSRFGLRMGDLKDLKKFKEKLYFLFELKKHILKKTENSFSKVYKKFLSLRKILLPFIVETEFILWKAVSKKKEILLEGAQGTLLDIDFGTYPNVTSSSCILASASQGSGIPPKEIKEIIGVVKAYTTRVGAKTQPFPTEMPEKLANILRERANEYGSTTGRPRRCGWLDGVLLKYAQKLNGFTFLAITKLDCLTGFDKLKICIKYKEKQKVVPFEKFSISNLENYKPIYLNLSGWKTFPSNCQKFSHLPREAQNYLREIEEIVKVPIKFVSFGPEREKILSI